MAHVLVIHAPADAATAGAVAAVLSDLTAFRVEVTPDRPLWRFGPNVVAVLVWTTNGADSAHIEAIKRVLASSAGRGLVFCFGGAMPPDEITRLCRVVLHQTDQPNDDTARLRAGILEAAATREVSSVSPGLPGHSAVQRLQTQAVKEAPRPNGKRLVGFMLAGLALAGVAGGLGLAFAAGGIDQLKELAADFSQRVAPPIASESFAKAAAASRQGADDKRPTKPESLTEGEQAYSPEAVVESIEGQNSRLLPLSGEAAEALRDNQTGKVSESEMDERLARASGKQSPGAEIRPAVPPT